MASTRCIAVVFAPQVRHWLAWSSSGDTSTGLQRPASTLPVIGDCYSCRRLNSAPGVALPFVNGLGRSRFNHKGARVDTLVKRKCGLQGGMGDVGKYVVSHALKAAGVTVKPVAMTSKATAEPKFDFEVDVKPQSLQDELKAVFDDVSPTQVVLEDVGAQQQLEQEFTGVDAVVACIGSRQPGSKYPELKARWCKSGADMVSKAMAATGVQRLVLLSSFGINDDFTPFSAIKLLWSAMLNTSLRQPKKDLYAMEACVCATELDYVLVRGMGLTPEAPPTGKWKVLSAKGQGRLGISIAKSDVAQFMLNEALEPSFHRQPVTVGSPA